MSKEYISRVKRDLRRSSFDFDEDISLLIEEAQKDLMLRGLSKSKAEDESDPIVFRYVSYYCKQHFGILTPEDYDKFSKALETQRNFLMLTSEYRGDAS